jgi:hypothetical protein
MDNPTATSIKIDGQWVPITLYQEWLKDAKRQGQKQANQLGEHVNN